MDDKKATKPLKEGPRVFRCVECHQLFRYNLHYHPKELIGHQTRQCCNLYDGLASHIYGNHCHAYGNGRRALEHAYKQSKWVRGDDNAA